MAGKSIICFCKHRTGYLGLRKLVAQHANIKLVIVQQGFESFEWYQRITETCQQTGIGMVPVRLLSRQPEIWQKIREVAPDFAFTIMFTQIIPLPVIEACNDKLVNFHPSLLPAYRGPHPVNWAIANGETRSGVTAHFVTEVVDGGPILMQEEFSIDNTDDNLTVQAKVDQIVEKQVGQCYDLLVAGNEQPIPQDESRNSYYRMRTPEDGRINWEDATTADVYNLIRSLQFPLEGAFTTFDGKRFVFRKAKPGTDNRGKEPGTVLHLTKTTLEIATLNGSITVTRMEDADHNIISDCRETNLFAGGKFSTHPTCEKRDSKDEA